jgi:hypothetical protein
MNILLFWIMCMLVVTMIFHPVYASTSGSLNDSNETLRNPNQENGQKEILNRDLTPKDSRFDTNDTETKTNLYSNPEFVLFDNKTGLVNLGLPSFWKDQFTGCEASFKCTANLTTGWKDNTSFQISTLNNTEDTISTTYGQEIEVKPFERYQLVTHMKLNNWATQSHIALEGFNETSTRWYQIEQCPSGHNGPLDWKEFSCIVTIPHNTTKIRPLLHSGWSSQENREAITFFDSLYMIKVSQFKADPNLKAELVFQGLEFPPGLHFYVQDDF